MRRLFDAHNHLQDERLDGVRSDLEKQLPALGVREMVVNGSCEEDWGQVAELARRHEWVRPAFGLHPWWVKGRGPEWRERLQEWWRLFPEAVVGEMGLDRWIPEPDVAAQRECFEWQWGQAVGDGRAITVHCLRAFGLLEEVLGGLPAAPRGFLLHSYGGPVEMVPGWVRRGAYFSLSPYFAHERKRGQLQTFRAVPLERLLIETDAPDMWPPVERNAHRLLLADGSEANSPLNVAFCYGLAAELRGMPVDELEQVVEANYRRLFGGG